VYKKNVSGRCFMILPSYDPSRFVKRNVLALSLSPPFGDLPALRADDRTTTFPRFLESSNTFFRSFGELHESRRLTATRLQRTRHLHPFFHNRTPANTDRAPNLSLTQPAARHPPTPLSDGDVTARDVSAAARQRVCWPLLSRQIARTRVCCHRHLTQPQRQVPPPTPPSPPRSRLVAHSYHRARATSRRYRGRRRGSGKCGVSVGGTRGRRRCVGLRRQG